MKILLKGLNVYSCGCFEKKDVLLDNGVVSFPELNTDDIDAVYEFDGKYAFPGFSDVHVHFREPGFSYKETVETGSRAAAHGGYTAVCTMPNLKPVPDTFENLKVQLDAIKSSAKIKVIPFASITKGQAGEELSDMNEMKDSVAGFSDDGKGVQSAGLMEKAMQKAKELDMIISAHCEDESLLFGGCIHDGEYARKNGFKGISSESEWKMIERDIELAKKTGCRYHVCHISTKESVELIRKAKADGVDITCETAPHYLYFCDEDLKDSGNFKMNPPIRAKEDRDALIKGICDGTIDMIATDHAPHSNEEKSKGLAGSLNGVVGLETAFPVLYTCLVKKGIISLEKLVELMSINPNKRFDIDCDLKAGRIADMTVFDLEKEYTVDREKLLSKGRSTPFEGEKVYGECLMTIADGIIVWEVK